MFTIKNYTVVKDLEEAYLLNQKRSNVILGGTLWLKMGKRSIQTAIDLSALGLDTIVETEESFEIGCMTTLRDMECHEGLDKEFYGVIKNAMKHIVGVQFRNGATVGGSIYGRYGFSDVLTCLLGLDTYVELYQGGRISLSEFATMKYDNDVLVKIIIKKDHRKVTYLTHRNTATDFPVLACTVALCEGQWEVVLGARPSKAKKYIDRDRRLGDHPTKDGITKFVTYVVSQFDFDSNMRGSDKYRRHLAGVLIERGIAEQLIQIEKN